MIRTICRVCGRTYPPTYVHVCDHRIAKGRQS